MKETLTYLEVKDALSFHKQGWTLEEIAEVLRVSMETLMKAIEEHRT